MTPNAIMLLGRLCFVLSCVGLSACSYTSDVMPMGPDTWFVTGMSEFSSVGARKAALEKAQKFAVSRGQHMVPVKVDTGQESDFFGDRIFTCEVTFRVLAKDDPDYERTNLDPTTKIVIQNERSRSPPDNDKYKKLRELKALLDEGVITQEEFDLEKKKILGGGF